MNEYATTILPKVSKWKPLFKKELIKCIRWAEPEEWFELHNWCYDNFYELYPDVLNEVYSYYSSEKNTHPNEITRRSQFTNKKKMYNN